MKNNFSKTWPFSRTAMALVYLLLLAGLVVYGKLYNPAVTLEMCLEEPEQFDGTLISVGIEAKVDALTPHGFIISEMGNTISVVGKIDNIKPEDFITITAIFHKEGWLELRQFYVATYRRIKIVASVFPALLIIILFLVKYAFDFNRFEFCERKKCRI